MTGSIYLGYSAGASGIFTQIGGSTSTDNLELGFSSGASGAYTLSGGTLSVLNDEYIGDGGSGAFTQSGGTHTVTSLIILGNAAGARGSYQLSGGSLGTVTEVVGNAGSGSFTQSGGTNAMTGDFTLGNNGGSGAYTLSAGSLSASAETVGGVGSGSFTQSGGTNAVANTLVLANNNGSTGTYTLSGTGSLTVGADEIIGANGSGSFTQSGGTNMVTGNIYLGDNSGARGAFTQMGGSTSADNLYLGFSSGASGAYTLSGGTLSVLNDEYIGDGGSGAFTQSGGTHTVASLIILGGAAGASGSYQLSGGSLGTVTEVVGNAGSGSFTQSGGTNSMTGNFTLANLGGTGAYTLNGGSLSASSETVGEIGSGSFTQSGGTNAVANTLVLADHAGSTGTYTLSGGSLAAATEIIGSSGSGTFSQTGGTNTDAGNLSVGVAPGTGTYALLGGTATVGGNYTQGANGTLATGISSPVNFEKLLVTGSAALNGTMDPVLEGGYIPAINTLFHGVITTGTGVTGTFSTVANPITAILYWQPVYTPTTFDLLVKGNFAGPNLDLTHNQANVGNMLNAVSGSASGDLANVLNTIADLPNNAAVANAYQQISPEKAAALSTLAFAGANLQKSTLSRRITDLRFGPEDVGLASGGGPASSILSYAQGGGLMVASSASSLAGLLTGQNNPNALEKPWGVYFDPGLVFGDQNSSADQTGFNFAMGGFTAGADYRVWQDLLLGLNTGYTYTSAGFNGSGGYVHGNTWPLNAYAAYLPKPFYAYGSLGYALNLYNLQRDISFGGLSRAADSSTTGNQLNAYGETGYDIKVNPVVLTPAVTLSFSKLWIGGFTESGAGALDLTVGSQNAQSLQTGVGGKIAVPMQRDTVTWTPQAYAFYQHEFSDSSRLIDARLSQTGTAFNYLTDDFSGQPHRNFAVVGADVTVATQKNLKVQLDYNAEVGRGNYIAHYVSAGLRWEF